MMTQTTGATLPSDPNQSVPAERSNCLCTRRAKPGPLARDAPASDQGGSCFLPPPLCRAEGENGSDGLPSEDPSDSTRQTEKLNDHYSDEGLGSHLHRPWSRLRAHVMASLATSTDAALVKQVTRMADCGKGAWVCFDAEGHPRIACIACKGRTCPRCQAHRGDVMARALREAISSWDRVRMVTLTRRSRREPLALTVATLTAQFAALRRRKWWRAIIDGGYVAVEVTRNAENGMWHPHLHVLTRGGYVPAAELRREWEAVVGETAYVDVREVPSCARGARYVTQYVTTPADMGQWPEEAVCEFALAMRSVRIMYSFGSQRGVSLVRIVSEQRPPRKERLIPLGALHAYALARSTRARRACELLWRMLPRTLNAANVWRPVRVDWETPVTGAERDELRRLTLSMLHDLEFGRDPVREEQVCARMAVRRVIAAPPPRLPGVTWEPRVGG